MEQLCLLREVGLAAPTSCFVAVAVETSWVDSYFVRLTTFVGKVNLIGQVER